MKIIIVGGTRPNFIKISPLHRELKKRNIDYILVHTGQHYDDNMSEIFFKEFELKKPDWNLQVGSFPHSIQTAKIMEKFSLVCEIEKPDMVIVVGDVNSTMACSLVVSKLSNVKLAHIEAGGRCFDKAVPEEVNRIVTDVLSDYLFAIEPSHVRNLLNEGINKEKVFLVGDNIIDNLIYTLSKIDYELVEKYLLVTIHRQENTDNINNLKQILNSLNELSKIIKIKFPMHPRTVNIIEKNNLKYLTKNIQVVDPLGYFDFVKAMRGASSILTDSGGITIESAFLGIPCVVVRETIERKFLLQDGVVSLSGLTCIVKNVNDALKKEKVILSKKYLRLLDGKASERICNILFGG